MDILPHIAIFGASFQKSNLKLNIMNQIVEKVLFSEKVAKFVVDAPRIAKFA